MQDTPGINPTANDLQFGFDELSWTRDNINERDAWARLGMAAEAGWVGEWVGGNLAFGWEVYDAGSGVLAVRSTGSDGTPLYYSRVRPNTARPLLGVDRAGRVLEIPPDSELLDDADAPVSALNDGVWYTLTASYRVRSREPGTLSITGGSTTITGVGTQFTRYRDGTATAGQPTILRIATDDTGAGNEGSYVIDEIIDDEELTVLVAPPATETGVEFRVKGRFNSGEPADPDIHLNPVVAWELVTRTTTRPTTALIAYDVRRSGGVVTLIDRRRANVYRRLDGKERSCALLPAGLYYDNGNAAGGLADDTMLQQEVHLAASLAGPTATSVTTVGISVAPCAVGSELAGLATDQPVGMMAAILWNDGATRYIQIRHYSPLGYTSGTTYRGGGGAWDDPDAGSTVNANTEVGMLDVSLVALPAGSGNTHVLYYVTSAGVLKARLTTDNGATWAAATTVVTPSGGATISRVSAILTRLNRIVIACAWSTGNRIRYVYSDDLGATYSINASSGYSSSSAGVAAVDVSVCQTCDGNLWTVAAVADTNGLRLYRGASESDPLPDAAEQTSGWKVGPDYTTPSVEHLEAVPMPDGTIGVVYTDAGTDTGRPIWYLQLGRKYPLHRQRLVGNSNSLGGAAAAPLGVGVSAGGIVHVVYTNRTLDPTDYLLYAQHARYIPVEVPRALSWWGGS